MRDIYVFSRENEKINYDLSKRELCVNITREQFDNLGYDEKFELACDGVRDLFEKDIIIDCICDHVEEDTFDEVLYSLFDMNILGESFKDALEYCNGDGNLLYNLLLNRDKGLVHGVNVRQVKKCEFGDRKQAFRAVTEGAIDTKDEDLLYRSNKNKEKDRAEYIKLLNEDTPYYKTSK